MKCELLLMTILMSVKAAPFIPTVEQQMKNNHMLTQQWDQTTMNQIAQQSLEQWLLQNQYNSMQQQLMAMQQFHAMKNTGYAQVPMLYNLPSQPIIVLVPNTMIKTNNRLENLNENDRQNLKFGSGDEDTVVINANEPNNPEMEMIPRKVVVLPNGQRLIIGSIISAIPFLPFEVNVPDTIAWIYNGISGIIGGIGQRLPFRPKPTTEKPVQQTEEPISSQESMTQVDGAMMLQETGIPIQERLKLIQKLMTRKQSMGMPILMLPLAQTVPIQLPIQV